MQTVVQIVQMIAAVLLIIAILLQHKGAGLGAGFGGTGSIVSTRRGVDLFLHKITIGLSLLFFALALVNLFI